MNNNHFFCYSKELFHYLTRERNHFYLFRGFTMKGNLVSIFVVTDRLKHDLLEYSKRYENGEVNHESC